MTINLIFGIINLLLAIWNFQDAFFGEDRDYYPSNHRSISFCFGGVSLIFGLLLIFKWS